jgi:hypothetical protein
MPKRLLVMFGGKNSPHNFLIKCLRFLLFDKGQADLRRVYQQLLWAELRPAIARNRKISFFIVGSHQQGFQGDIRLFENVPLNTREPFSERFASEAMELSTRHNFVFFLAIGSILRGWAWSALGRREEGLQMGLLERFGRN